MKWPPWNNSGSRVAMWTCQDLPGAGLALTLHTLRVTDSSSWDSTVEIPFSHFSLHSYSLFILPDSPSSFENIPSVRRTWLRHSRNSRAAVPPALRFNTFFFQKIIIQHPRCKTNSQTKKRSSNSLQGDPLGNFALGQSKITRWTCQHLAVRTHDLKKIVVLLLGHDRRTCR